MSRNALLGDRLRELLHAAPATAGVAAARRHLFGTGREARPGTGARPSPPRLGGPRLVPARRLVPLHPETCVREHLLKVGDQTRGLLQQQRPAPCRVPVTRSSLCPPSGPLGFQACAGCTPEAACEAASDRIRLREQYPFWHQVSVCS